MLDVVTRIDKFCPKPHICINGFIHLNDSLGHVTKIATKIKSFVFANNNIGATSDKEICVISIIFGTIACRDCLCGSNGSASSSRIPTFNFYMSANSFIISDC